MSFYADLKHRKVVQWALAYAAAAWLLVQVVDVLGGRWGLSNAAARTIDVALITGFFIAIIIAWYHGDRGRQRVGVVEAVLVAAVLAGGGIGVTLIDRNAEPAAGTGTAQQRYLPPRDMTAAPWLAVTPFRVIGDGAAIDGLADSLTSEVVAGLARFSHLLVISRATTEAAMQKVQDPRELGRELGARYVLQAELRQSGDTLRVSAQLIDALDGTTVWSERLQADLADADLFALQDRLTERLVATVADVSGVVTRAMAALLRDKSPQEMTPYEAILQFSVNRQSVSAASHLRSRQALERAVELEPGYADAWACLAHVYLEEFISQYNVLPDSLDRAYDAVQRAVELDKNGSLTQYTLSMIQYFRRNLGAFNAAMERAIELNPYDSQTWAMLGILLGYGGDWERSVAMTTRAMSMNPHHPGWYRFNTFFNEYRQENYEAALDIALRVNTPGYWGDGLARALAHAQLGNEQAAAEAAADILAVWPSFEADYYALGLENWMYAQPDLMAHILDGLDRAGLDMHRGDLAARMDSPQVTD